MRYHLFWFTPKIKKKLYYIMALLIVEDKYDAGYNKENDEVLKIQNNRPIIVDNLYSKKLNNIRLLL